MGTQNKPWYKKWWGILIVLCFWPYLLIWYAWARSRWSKVVKIVATVACCIVALFGFMVIAAAASGPQTSTPNPDTVTLTATTSEGTPQSKTAKPTHAPSTKTTPVATATPAPVATTAPAPVSAPVATDTPAPATGCYPTTDEGKCYEPGEFCRNSDHGALGIAGDGTSIRCMYNNRWRWEPSN